MKTHFLALLLSLCPLLSVAQRSSAFNWEGGLIIGSAYYVGDLNPSLTPNFNELKPFAGIMGRMPVSRRFAIRSGFAYGRFIGDESNYPQRVLRGYSFQTDVFEMNMLIEFEPFARDKFYSDSRGNLHMEKLISPYLFAGGGFCFALLNPDFTRVADATTDPGITEDRRASSSRMIPLIPAGVGVKFDLNLNLGVALEASGRLSFTDYLDGISKSANPEENDSFLMVNLCFFKRF